MGIRAAWFYNGRSPVVFLCYLFLVLWITTLLLDLSTSTTSAPMQASEAQSFNKYVIGEELPGEIVAWRGYSGAFVLQDVKLGDGRIVVAASKIRVNQDVHQKVYVAESVWQDRKSGESFYILTRYRQ